jgi:hypothetical protein
LRPVHEAENMSVWMERFPARDLNRRLPELKQARDDGWDLSVLVAPGGRTIIVVGWYQAQLSLFAQGAA